MVKTCQWGLCKSDSRHPERLDGIFFIPFVKPRKDKAKCERWIKACGRPSNQLNCAKVNKDRYICSKHFQEIINGRPSERFPDPVPATPTPRTRPTLYPRPRPKITPSKRQVDVQPLKPSNSDNISLSDRDKSPPETINLLDRAGNESEKYDTEMDTIENIPITTPDANLALLAMAAENSALADDNAAMKLQIAGLREQLQESQQLHANEMLNNEALRRRTEEPTIVIMHVQQRMTLEDLHKNASKSTIKSYTGFSHDDLKKVFNFLVPDPTDLPFEISSILISCTKCLPIIDQFLLVMLKLRQNFTFLHLSNLFLISSTDAGRLFRAWINFMYFRLGSLPIWPNRESIQARMPEKFAKDFPNTLIILDGTEMKTERPKSLRIQSLFYSDYKSATTLKALVGVDPSGAFIFVSMLFSGPISDKEITARSGLLDVMKDLMSCGKIKSGDGVMVDKGFTIEKEIANLGLKLWIPPFVSGGSTQMSASEVSKTKKIARHRIVVENAIGRAKKFKILDQKLSLSMFPTVNQIFSVCCLLTNFMPPLLLAGKK